MRILLKFPSRGRPQQFLKTLKGWIDSASNLDRITLMVTYDTDDATMTAEILRQVPRGILTFLSGVKSGGKISAVNIGMDTTLPWDIVLVVSDDMICRRKGWDEIIRQKMSEHYPDTDGVLWFHDGSKQREIMTLSCIGRKYFERDGFIYHPSYFSFFCDNEATDVARQRGKLAFIENPIASHEHPSWNGGMKPDATYARNNRFWNQDKENYNRRQALGFPA